MSLHEYLLRDPRCQNLAEGAIYAVAPLLEDPDPAPVLGLLDEWAYELAGRMPLPWNLHSAVDVLNHYLFHEQGLHGDSFHFDAPENAVLPLVLARKQGLPISLSIVWIDVARRLGFDAVGVALPGHFIAALRTEMGLLCFDPFQRGQAIGEELAERLVRKATGGRAVFDPAMLVPAENRAVLARLVRNLHVRYMSAHDWDEALWTSTHIALLAPLDPDAYRDRAFVHLHRGDVEKAYLDLQEAIRLSQEPDPQLAQLLTRLQRR